MSDPEEYWDTALILVYTEALRRISRAASDAQEAFESLPEEEKGVVKSLGCHLWELAQRQSEEGREGSEDGRYEGGYRTD